MSADPALPQRHTVRSLRFRIVLGTIVATSVVVLVSAVIAWSAMQVTLLHDADHSIAALLAHHMAGPPGPRGERGAPGEPPPGAPGGPERHGPPGESNDLGDRLPPPEPRDSSAGDRPAGDQPTGDRFAPDGGREPGPHHAWAPRIDPDGLVELVSDDGRILFRSPALRREESLQVAVRPGWHGEPQTAVLASGRLVRIGRATASRHGPEGEQRILIYAACDIERAQGEVDRLALLLGVLWLGATLLAVAVSVALQRAILRPVARISAQLIQLGPERLAARLPDDLAPRELQPMVGQLNDLLSRVEAAFIREKTTIANIAHELRTPVASLRCSLEFALADQAPLDRTVAERCLGVTLELQRLITNLLALARLEAGLEQIVRQPVELIDLVERSWQPVADAAKRRSVTFSGQAACCGCFVATGTDQARVALGNLLGNAVVYAASGSVITLTVTVGEDLTRLTIANDTDQPVPPVDQLGRAFVRGDAARTVGDHAGLGLALTSRLMPLLGGELTLSVPQPNRFCATLAFPTAESPV